MVSQSVLLKGAEQMVQLGEDEEVNGKARSPLLCGVVHGQPRQCIKTEQRRAVQHIHYNVIVDTL